MNTITAPLLGLVGVLIGTLIAISRERAKAKRDFLSRQLSEFYSPMVGIREEIRILSEYRITISKYAGDVFKELREIGGCSENPEELKKLLEPETKKTDTRIEYDNIQLREYLLPAYQRMANLFRENYWLAESETRKYFTPLVEFVEGWNRFLSRSLSSEVLQKLDINESALLPFYDHLERTHDELKKKVKDGLD